MAEVRTSRARTSTGSSRLLSTDEEESSTVKLLRQLSPSVGDWDRPNLLAASSVVGALRRELEDNDSAKSTFRHAKGFEALLDLLRTEAALDEDRLPPYSRLIQSILFLVCEAIRDHRGNRKYFKDYLHGWKIFQEVLSNIQELLTSDAHEVGHEWFWAFLFRSLLLAAFRTGPRSYDTPGTAEGNNDISSDDLYVVSGNEVLHNAETCAIAIGLSLCFVEKSNKDLDKNLSIALSLIQVVAAVTDSSLRNKVALWETDLTSNILQILLESADSQAIDPLRRLYSVLAPLGLPSLNDVSRLFEKAFQSEQARDILLATLRDSRETAYIQFDLSLCGYSSVEIPSLPRAFPPTYGYTMTAWVRIGNFDPNVHTTIFGAFDTSQSCFVLLYIERDSHHLILQTSIRASRPSVRFKSVRFRTDKWYHVVLVHRRSTGESRQSSVALFVDGEFAEQIKCTYPEPPPDQEDAKLSRPSPGTSELTRARRTMPVQAFFGTPHDLAVRLGEGEVASRWDMAGAHLYSVPLSDEFVAVHHRLGRRYSGNLQDCLGPLLSYRASAELNRYNELLHPDKSDKVDKSDVVTATESRGSEVVAEGKLLISISPTAVINFEQPDRSAQASKQQLDRKALQRYHHLSQKSKAVAINAAIPNVSEAISRSYGTGVLTGDPVVVVPGALDDASWCLAGCLPILLRLLSTATSETAFLQAIQIFSACTSDNWRISEAMEKGNGFGLLAALIREKLGFESILSSINIRQTVPSLSTDNRGNLELQLLQLVLEFVGYNKDRPENSIIINPMAYRVLLVDFDTWRRCDIETQKLYYKQYAHFVVNNKHQNFNQKRLVRMRVVRKLIDALKSEDISTDAIKPLLEAIRALIDTASTGPLYRELAMFVSFGLEEERVSAAKPLRNMASVVALRQKSAAWAKTTRRSRPATPSPFPTPQVIATRTELAVRVLELLCAMLRDDRTGNVARRLSRAVPQRWLLHLLAESDVKVVTLSVGILCQLLGVLGLDFKASFVEKNGGFITLKHRLRVFWSSASIWTACLAMMFGSTFANGSANEEFTLFNLINLFAPEEPFNIANPEILPTIMSMLEAGIRHVVKEDAPSESDVRTLKTVVQFLSEIYDRSTAFRDFAATSRYVQEILFVLYPVLVGSDRLSAETELQSDKDALSFGGEEVKMRPHSNSVGERPPSVRSLSTTGDKRSPSPRMGLRVEAPKRPSSFLLVNAGIGNGGTSPAQFTAAMRPKKVELVKINVGNALVESLLEVTTALFIDLVCNKEKFNGIGLFLKVPPGFREHQAYFESYILVHTLTQLWNHLQLDQSLFLETKVLTNISRYTQHMSEAVFEGWFIDGAQPLLDFTGKVLDYLQQPEVASIKVVRLCSQHVNSIRLVFLRVSLWTLSELDESTNEAETIAFLEKMSYWQTILFSPDNHEALFTRLICFLLYMKLTSDSTAVRIAAVKLWRTVIIQKPMETATLLTFAMGSDQRHLSTGFMRLVSSEDEEFLNWLDENRASLDSTFDAALRKPWDEFVAEENRRAEESAGKRLSKRRDKLRLWHAEETQYDDFIYRYETSTNHWRSNVHAQERLKLQRAVQDHQEYVNHLVTIYGGIEKTMTQPAGYTGSTAEPKWQLDETEGINRMRLRTVQAASKHEQVIHSKRKASDLKSAARPVINTQISRVVGNDAMSAIPASPVPDSPLLAMQDGLREIHEVDGPAVDTVSGSQLLEGDFELVDDPKEAENGLIEDKNRKVMTSLQRGDIVQQLYNISRIVGLEACEGLLVVGKKCLYLQDNFFQRSDGEIVSVSQAPEDERDPYVQLISGKDVGSSRTRHSIGDRETRFWTWKEVLSISKRRFLFRDVSVEVFFTDGRSYLLTCSTSNVRDDLFTAVVTRAPHVHSSTSVASEDAWRLDTLRNPQEAPQSLGSKFANVFNSAPSHVATKKWAKSEMSNFQYLMLVNTMAGRTFNDLTQYPVFPWVIADYSSEELDLKDPKSFRDLSRPMGCQTKARAAEYRDRYKQFAEMGDHNAPPFHYGTHYSSAMIVSSYLIRLQPFVHSYLLLQGGSFDHADRLFDSIEKAWISVSRDNMSDVRELTPEFFYLPDFLTNINKYDFGTKQANGETVNNVVLPPWAKGDPQIFVAKNRDALESPYVSEHLHKWIDLVFGYKQRGEAAVAATNVFQHLSYQGAKDLDTIDDPMERLASIGIIHSFGQTPHQVFQKPHPARETNAPTISRLDTLAESLIKLRDPLFESDQKITDLTFSPTQERLLYSSPCKINMLPNCDRYLQWDFVDNSIRFFSANTKRLLGLYENTHLGRINAAIFADSKTLVTGGEDCTIGLWDVAATRDHVNLQPKTYLFGHRTPLALLAASRVFSTLLSASTDGHILLWGLNRHQCIRVLHAAGQPPISAARISNVSGHILICQGPNVLLYTLNGHLLLKQNVCDSDSDPDSDSDCNNAEEGDLLCCAFYEGAGNEWLERELLFTGHGNGVVNVWALTVLGDGAWYLLLVKRLSHGEDFGGGGGGNGGAAITAILPMPHGVYTGDEEGRVWQWDCVMRQGSLGGRGR